MKGASLLVVFFVCGACVPASEKLPPKGAAGYRVEPSAAKGEAFVVQGWTIRFEKLVVRARVFASGEQSFDSTGTEAWTWDGRRPVEVFVPEISPGRTFVNVSLTSIDGDDDSHDDRDESGEHVVGVSAEDQARFLDVADDGSDANVRQPALTFRAQAERDGRTISVSLALRSQPVGYITSSPVNTPGPTNNHGAFVTVSDDMLATTALRVEAERIFPDFDAIASADVDNNGVVTAQELAGVTVQTSVCPGCEGVDASEVTSANLLLVTGRYANTILVQP